MRAVALVVVVSACGRFDFARESGIDAATVVPDTAIKVTCGGAASTPPTASIAGSTYQFTSFTTTTPVPSAAITILDQATATTLAMTTSDGNGAYSDSFATNSAALDVVVVASASSYMTTYNYLGATIGAAVMFDSPLWNSGAIDTVYSAAGASRDPTAGTLNVGVFHCDGSLYDGVVVAVDPPSQLEYIGANGVPTTTLTATVLPYTYALILNAVGGATTVTASTPGGVFTPQVVSVATGESVTRLSIYGE